MPCTEEEERGRDAEKPFPLLLRMSKRGGSSGGERESGTELPREEKVCRPTDSPTEGSSIETGLRILFCCCAVRSCSPTAPVSLNVRTPLSFPFSFAWHREGWVVVVL